MSFLAVFCRFFLLFPAIFTNYNYAQAGKSSASEILLTQSFFFIFILFYFLHFEAAEE